MAIAKKSALVTIHSFFHKARALSVDVDQVNCERRACQLRSRPRRGHAAAARAALRHSACACGRRADIIAHACGIVRHHAAQSLPCCTTSPWRMASCINMATLLVGHAALGAAARCVDAFAAMQRGARAAQHHFPPQLQIVQMLCAALRWPRAPPAGPTCCGGPAGSCSRAAISSSSMVRAAARTRRAHGAHMLTGLRACARAGTRHGHGPPPSSHPRRQPRRSRRL